MCLAIPARIVQLDGDRAVADAMGNRWQISTTLTPEVRLGDLVLVHAGYAISTVEEQEARETWELFKQFQMPSGEITTGFGDLPKGRGNA
jgi:hydrogenase expression/formation protein HypC